MIGVDLAGRRSPSVLCILRPCSRHGATESIGHGGNMVRTSRRSFIKTTSLATMAAAISQSTGLRASPFGLPIGIQLFSVREMLAKDFPGTLKLLSTLGYQEVDAAGFYDHSPEDVKQALQKAGLTCPSAHYNFNLMTTQTDQIIAFGKALGLQYIVCSTPGSKD